MILVPFDYSFAASNLIRAPLIVCFVQFVTLIILSALVSPRTWHTSYDKVILCFRIMCSSVIELLCLAPSANHVVQRHQSFSKSGEDKGDDCRLSKNKHPASSSVHQWCCCGENEQHQVSGCTHNRRPLLNQQRLITGPQSSARPIFPLQPEENQSPNTNHVLFLLWHHGDQLHHCEVWKLHLLQQRIVNAAGEDHWCLTPSLPLQNNSSHHR